MVMEAAVFEGQQHPNEEGIHFLQGYWQAPAAIGDGEGAQQAAIAIQDQGRGRHCRHLGLDAGGEKLKDGEGSDPGQDKRRADGQQPWAWAKTWIFS
jgi:hypothetical protein